MRFFDGLKLAFKNLWRVRFRTFLTVLGVIIGISAIVLFVSLGLGLQKITSDQIASVSALTSINISQKPATSSMEEGPALDDKTVERISALNGVEKASVSVNLPSNVVMTGTNAGAIVFGINPDDQDLEISGLQKGNLVAKGQSEAVISSALANAFNADPDNVIGQSIIIKVVKNVEGLDYKTSELSLKVTGIDNNDTTNIVYAPLDQIYKAGQFDKYSSIKVKVKSRKDIDDVKSEINKMGYQTSTIKDLIDQIDKVFLIAEIILGFIGGIGLLVSSLGIINTMTIALLERTHEIGIMKAIGASDKDIRKIFFLESALIGFFGGISGIALAMLTGFIFNSIINLLIKNSGQQLNLFITPILFSGIMVAFSILISVFAGIYPAYRAKKLIPIDALRQ